MNDDFNTPKAMAGLFDLVTKINSFKDGHTNVNQLSTETLSRLISEMNTWFFDILGLRDDDAQDGNADKMDGVMQLVLDLRQQARTKKDFALSDQIRDRLTKVKIVVKDGKEGASWSYE